MEAIEIKNCSSTLPTLSQGVIPSKRLCKTLFGPVDHEELSNILDFELSRELKKKNEEWCFNFAEGTPVKHGPLVWEEMKQRNDEKPSTELQGKPCKEQRVPKLHSETIHCSDGMFNCQPNTPVKSTTTTHSQLKISPDAVTSENPSADIEGPLVLERKRKRQCRTITDFMKQKKRRRTSNSSLPEKRYQGSSLVDSCSPKSELSISGSAKKIKVSN